MPNCEGDYEEPHLRCAVFGPVPTRRGEDASQKGRARQGPRSSATKPRKKRAADAQKQQARHNCNQGNCGSCWAQAATEAFSDRVCIASGGAASAELVLSAQAMIDCDAHDAGCDGGFVTGRSPSHGTEELGTLTVKKY